MKTIINLFQGHRSPTYLHLLAMTLFFCVFSVGLSYAQAPTTPASNLTFSSIDGNRFGANFTRGNGAKRIIIAKAESPVTAVPVDGIDYLAAAFGAGNEIAPGEFVVYNGTSYYADIMGLQPSTTYHLKIFEYNGSDYSTEYLTSSYLEGSQSTVTNPTVQASDITFNNVEGSKMNVSWTNGNGSGRILIARANEPVNFEPEDLVQYSIWSTGYFGRSGYDLGSGNYVLYRGTGNSVNVTNLEPNTTYHFALFEYNGSNGFVYLTPSSESNSAPAAIGSENTEAYPTLNSTNMNFQDIDGNLFRYRILSNQIGNGEKRLIIAKKGSAVSASPVDGEEYSASNYFGQGEEIASGEYVVFNGSGNPYNYLYDLEPNTTYYFKVYEYNGSGDGTYYLKTTDTNDIPVLEANQSTLTNPSTQASNVTFSDIEFTKMKVSWTNGNGSGRILVARANEPVNFEPEDLVQYSIWSTGYFGRSGYDLGSGNYVLYRGTGNSVNVTNLEPNTTYHFALFEYNGSNGFVYLTPSSESNPAPAAIGSQNTEAYTSPTLNSTNINFQDIDGNLFRYRILSNQIGNGEKRLIIAKKGSAVSASPVDGEEYSASNYFGQGEEIASGEYVVFNGSGNPYDYLYDLEPNTTYYFKVYEYNGSGEETYYLKTTDTNDIPVLEANQSTLTNPSTQASNITFSDVEFTKMKVSWTNGNGSGRILVARANEPVNFEPEDLVNYSYYSTGYFGRSGYDLGSGNYVLYRGTGNSVNVTNLEPNTTYHFALFEYNGSNGFVYLTPSSESNSAPAAIGSQNTEAYTSPTLNSTNINFQDIDGNLFRYRILSNQIGNGEKRLIIAKKGSAVSASPVDGEEYSTSNYFGQGEEIASGEYVVFNGSGNPYNYLYDLEPNTTYYFKVFEYNGSGEETYYLKTTDTNDVPVLEANQSTISAPTVQTGSVYVNSKTTSSFNINWTRGNGSNRILIARANEPVDAEPQDLVNYSSWNAGYGNPSYQIGNGNYVLYAGTGNSVNVTNLQAGTNYHFALFEYNGSSGRVYLRPGYSFEAETFGATPTNQVSNINFSEIGGSSMKVNFTRGNGSARLVIARKGAAVDVEPSDNITYSADADFGNGQEIGSGNFVVYNGTGESFNLSNLDSASTYHFAFFEYAINNDNELYLKPGATASQVTSGAPTVIPDDFAYTRPCDSDLILTWTSGNGQGRLVVLSEAPLNTTPTNGVEYNANFTYGNGDALGNGFVVYNAGSNLVPPNGLEPGTNYYVNIFEYNGTKKDPIFNMTPLSGFIGDISAPSVSCQNIQVVLDDSGQVSITAEDIGTIPVDDCGVVTAEIDIDSFDCSNLGQNTVTFTLTDSEGNSSSCTSVVTVVDQTPPTVMTKNITIQLDSTGSATIANDAVDDGSTDNCGALTFHTDLTSFDDSHIGENTVTLMVTDESNNSSSATAVVTVLEADDPIGGDPCEAPDITVKATNQNGEEIDCVVEGGQYYILVEITGGSGNQTYSLYDNLSNSSTLTILDADDSALVGPYNAGVGVVITAEGNDNNTCLVESDEVNPDSGPALTWYKDNDGDGYGTEDDFIISCSEVEGYSLLKGDCDDNDPTINPDAQTLTVLGTTGFEDSFINPKIGSPTTTFEFAVVYTDANNALPPFGYPRVILDYEGNGNYNNTNDRTIMLIPADQNDLNTADGKVYVGSINQLPAGTDWEAHVQIEKNGCLTKLGPIDYPKVLIQSNLQIFANDIEFDNPNPEVSSPLQVSATVHNVSDFPAENFVMHLRNQFDTSAVYPDITVDFLDAHSSTTVTWDILTPPVPSWNPMEVFVDYTNVIEETNELDNRALRPFINGDYNLPGAIVVEASASPVSQYAGSNKKVTISGYAYYTDTAVPLQDSTVAGAHVTLINPTTGEVKENTTNSNGYFSVQMNAGSAVGDYFANGEVTDYSLTGSFTPTWSLIEAPCLPNLQTNVYLNHSIIFPGETVSGSVVVKNNGCTAIEIPTLLEVTQSDGSPLIEDVMVPPLAKGESYTYYFEDIEMNNLGNQTICGEADANHEVPDLNPNSGKGCRSVSVVPPLPDITPGNGGLLSAPGYICNQTYPSFGIRNIGYAPTGEFDVQIDVYYSDNLIETYIETIDNIDGISEESPGAKSKSITIPFEYENVGEYSFTVQADIPLPNGAVVEISENNNKAVYTKTILACKPDLRVLSCRYLNVDPFDLEVPGMATYTAEIKNSGNAVAQGPIEFEFKISNGEVYPLVYQDDLAPGETVTMTVDAPAIQSGSENLTAVVDPNELIEDSNRNNNSYSDNLCYEFSAVPKCGNTNFWQRTYAPNETTQLSVGLKAEHLYKASEVKVRFEVSGPGIDGTQFVGDAVVENVKNLCGACPYVAVLPNSFVFNEIGTYTFTMTADPDNEYSECDETNNVLIREVEVKNLPDMRILSQYINPTLLNPEADQAIFFDISYENIGKSNINDLMKLAVKVDNDILAEIPNVPGLIKNTIHTISIPVPYATDVEGMHVVRAIIDADDEIAELNELNNEATRSFVVGPAANLYFGSFEASADAGPSPLPFAGEGTNGLPFTTFSNGNNAITSIDALIKNNGDLDVLADVKFSYTTNVSDTIYLGTIQVEIPAGGSQQISHPWEELEASATVMGEIINVSELEFDTSDNFASTELNVFNIDITSVNSCENQLGSLTVVASDGVPPYSYNWSNGFVGSVFEAGPGTYSVTVIDAEGNRAVASGTIQENPDCVDEICSISAVSFNVPNSCDAETGVYHTTLVIAYENAPASGHLLVNGFEYEITGSPQIVDVPFVSGDLVYEVSFSDSDDCGLTIITGVSREECMQDCEGTYGGDVLPGAACDDGDDTTENDTINENCECVGTTIEFDCEEIGADIGEVCYDEDGSEGVVTQDCDCYVDPNPEPELCDAPTNVMVSDITEDSATITWTGNADEYVVYYTDGVSDWTENTSNTIILLEGLSSDTDYILTVSSYCEEELGGESDLVEFSTLGEALSYDCEDLGADIGDICYDEDDNEGIVDDNCECFVEETPVYDCEELGADIGDICYDEDGNEGVVDDNCECFVEETPVYDCDEMEADFGEVCYDEDGNEGVVTEDCDCYVAPVYDCDEMEADYGEVCYDEDGNEGIVTEDCDCYVEQVDDCEVPSSDDNNIFISKIHIDGIGVDIDNNYYDLDYTSSVKSENGYAVVNSPEFTIYPNYNGSYTVSSGPAGNGGAYYYAVWIDFNADGCFDEDEQVVWSAGAITNDLFDEQDVPAEFSALAPGTYTARIRNSMQSWPNAHGAGDGETLDFTIHIVSEDEAEHILGIDNKVFNNFSFYPNPVQNQLNLKSDRPLEQVDIYNLLGQKVISIQPNSLTAIIDTDQLQAGVYMMSVSIDGSQKTYKVVRK